MEKKNKDSLINSRFTSSNSVFDNEIQAMKTHFWVDAYVVSSKLRYFKKTEKNISGEEMFDICKSRALRYLGLFLEPSSDSSSGSSSGSTAHRIEEERELERRLDKRIQQMREGIDTPGWGGENQIHEHEGSLRVREQQELKSNQGNEIPRRKRDVYGGLDKLQILGLILKDIKREFTLPENITPPLYSFSTSPFSSYPVDKLMELQSLKQMKKFNQNSDVTFRVKAVKLAPRSLYGPLMEGEEEVAEQSEYDTMKKKGASEIEREWEVEGFKWGDDYEERDRDSERDRARIREKEMNTDNEKVLIDQINTVEDFDLFGNKNKIAITDKENHGSYISQNQNSYTNIEIKHNRSGSSNSYIGNASNIDIHIKTALKTLLMQLAGNCYFDENKALIVQHLSSYLLSEREKQDYDEGNLIPIY